MSKQNGFTLIELIIFILVVGLGLAGILNVFLEVLDQSPMPSYIEQAQELAKARMEIILSRAYFLGFSSLSDVCTSGSPPTVCTISQTGYTTTSTINTVTFNTDSNYRSVVVTVTGPRATTVTLTSLVANH